MAITASVSVSNGVVVLVQIELDDAGTTPHTSLFVKPYTKPDFDAQSPQTLDLASLVDSNNQPLLKPNKKYWLWLLASALATPAAAITLELQVTGQPTRTVTVTGNGTPSQIARYLVIRT